MRLFLYLLRWLRRKFKPADAPMGSIDSHKWDTKTQFFRLF
ncbi:MAG: hypothetical protein ACYS8Z_17720 [Planctomycetota bacterium]